MTSQKKIRGRRRIGKKEKNIQYKGTKMEKKDGQMYKEKNRSKSKRQSRKKQ